MPNLIPALPEIFLVCVAMLMMMLGVYNRKDNTRFITYVAVTAMAIAAVYIATFDASVRQTTFNGMFVVDSFAVFAKVMVLVASGVTAMMSISFLESEKMERFEYPVLLVFATVGMMMMISANDLISLYVGLELQSLSLYVLAAYQRESSRATEAGLKYFVLGALASGLLLYGASLIYGFAGSTSFDALAEVLGGNEAAPIGVIVGMVFVLSGLAFKVSAVPFHMWTPDVYEGAPTSVTAFFAVAPKIAALALLARVMIGPFGHMADQWQQVVVVLSALSMFVGAFAAIGQTNIKRLMAYSSIGHVGYALMGIATADTVGIRGVLIYLAIYLFMNLGTFAVILSMRQKGRMLEGVSDFAGLSKSRPMMALSLAIFMFSMAGIPPLAGFFGKFYVFLAAIDAGLITLAVIGVLTSVVSAFYYLRIIKVMYFDEPIEAFDRPVGRSLGLVTGVSAFAILAFTFLPAPLMGAAQVAAASLFGG